MGEALGCGGTVGSHVLSPINLFLGRAYAAFDVEEILKIRASPRRGDDVIAWGPEKLGVFSVKSAYHLAFDELHRSNAASSSTSPSGARSCWKFIWNCGAPPTVSNFAWRVATDGLPTWKNKHKIGLETTSICPVCGSETEDNFHPFVRCQFGRDLYMAMAKVWRLPHLQSLVNCGKEWLLQVLATRSELERCMLLLIFWRSWYVRNELVHHKPAPPMDVSVSFLRSYLESLMAIKNDNGADPVKSKAYITMDPREKPVAQVPKSPRWAKLSQGWTKLNTDGAFVSSDEAGAGMILRDSSGKIVFSACRALYSYRDVLEAELCACMEGLSSSIQRTELPIEIEMDSSVAVSMITCGGTDRSAYSSLVNEIRLLLNLHQTCITHVARSQNKASDRLAAFGCVNNRTMTWVGSGPPEVLEIVAEDCNDNLIE